MVLDTYKVKTLNFEGPFEVLLNLIEKRKLFINEISLATITDDYISYVKEVANKDLGQYAAFISIAATLILIKSRSLIPNLELTEEEKNDIGSLERRLELYQLIKEIGRDIEEKFGKEIIFGRLPNKIEIKVFAPDPQISQETMLTGIMDVVKALPEVEAPKPEVVVMKVRSLEETINDLIERVKVSVKMSFRDFSKGNGSGNRKEEKVGVIVSFLAMLELVRQGFIDAVQDNDFGEINLEKMESPTENNI